MHARGLPLFRLTYACSLKSSVRLRFSRKHVCPRPSADSLLPVPKGEGRGEGEGIVRQPIAHKAAHAISQPSIYGYLLACRRSARVRLGLQNSPYKSPPHPAQFTKHQHQTREQRRLAKCPPPPRPPRPSPCHRKQQSHQSNLQRNYRQNPQPHNCQWKLAHRAFFISAIIFPNFVNSSWLTSRVVNK